MRAIVTDDFEPMHSDGAPWRKACPECAFRRSNPQGLSDEQFAEMYLNREFGFSFVCAHRKADGAYRECACWAAMEAGRASGGLS